MRCFFYIVKRGRNTYNLNNERRVLRSTINISGLPYPLKDGVNAKCGPFSVSLRCSVQLVCSDVIIELFSNYTSLNYCGFASIYIQWFTCISPKFLYSLVILDPTVVMTTHIRPRPSIVCAKPKQHFHQDISPYI